MLSKRTSSALRAVDLAAADAVAAGAVASDDDGVRAQALALADSAELSAAPMVVELCIAVAAGAVAAGAVASGEDGLG